MTLAMAISGDYGDVRPEYFRPPRSDAASQEFGVPLHEIHPAREMNDHNLLRKMLEDVEPGWEGHVLAGNCEYAEGEGDPDKINAANRLYALWERQGTESREDLSCDTEHAESEGETEKTHAGRTKLGAGIDPCWERTACRLVALLEETQEEQERQGTASGQDAPLHGLQPGRMSHGSSDEDDAKRRATPHRKACQKEYDA